MVCKGNKAGGEEAESTEHQYRLYCQSTGQPLSWEAETPVAVPNPAGSPPQGHSRIRGTDAWWEGDRSARAVVKSRRDGNREGFYISTPLYILPFPSSGHAQPLRMEDGKGKQEVLAMPAGTRREARGKKSQGSQGKVSLTCTVLIPSYPALNLFTILLPHDCLCSPALHSPETSAETASEKRIAAEIECHANALENGNKAHPCS